MLMNPESQVKMGLWPLTQRNRLSYWWEQQTWNFENLSMFWNRPNVNRVQLEWFFSICFLDSKVKRPASLQLKGHYTDFFLFLAENIALDKIAPEWAYQIPFTQTRFVAWYNFSEVPVKQDLFRPAKLGNDPRCTEWHYRSAQHLSISIRSNGKTAQDCNSHKYYNWGQLTQLMLCNSYATNKQTLMQQTNKQIFRQLFNISIRMISDDISSTRSAHSDNALLYIMIRRHFLGFSLSPYCHSTCSKWLQQDQCNLEELRAM